MLFKVLVPVPGAAVGEEWSRSWAGLPPPPCRERKKPTNHQNQISCSM